LLLIANHNVLNLALVLFQIKEHINNKQIFTNKDELFEAQLTLYLLHFQGACNKKTKKIKKTN